MRADRAGESQVVEDGLADGSSKRVVGGITGLAVGDADAVVAPVDVVESQGTYFAAA
jgi:hypothetical protein